MIVSPSKARRDFLFRVFVGNMTRLALHSRFVESRQTREQTGDAVEFCDGVEYREESDVYKAARQKWVGQDDAEAAEQACSWLEEHIGAIFENEAENEFRAAKGRARTARVDFDARACRERVSRKPNAFKAKLAEFKRIETERAAARSQGGAAQAG